MGIWGLSLIPNPHYPYFISKTIKLNKYSFKTKKDIYNN